MTETVRACLYATEAGGTISDVGHHGEPGPTPMTTHRMGIEQAEGAVEPVRTRSDGLIKPLITF